MALCKKKKKCIKINFYSFIHYYFLIIKFVNLDHIVRGGEININMWGRNLLQFSKKAKTDTRSKIEIFDKLL